MTYMGCINCFPGRPACSTGCTQVLPSCTPHQVAILLMCRAENSWERSVAAWFSLKMKRVPLRMAQGVVAQRCHIRGTTACMRIEIYLVAPNPSSWLMPGAPDRSLRSRTSPRHPVDHISVSQNFTWRNLDLVRCCFGTGGLTL